MKLLKRLAKWWNGDRFKRASIPRRWIIYILSNRPITPEDVEYLFMVSNKCADVGLHGWQNMSLQEAEDELLFLKSIGAIRD